MSEVRGPVESSYPRAARRRLGLPRFNADTYESGTQHATLHRGQSFQLCGSAEQRAAGPHTQQIIKGPPLGLGDRQAQECGGGGGSHEARSSPVRLVEHVDPGSD